MAAYSAASSVSASLVATQIDTVTLTEPGITHIRVIIRATPSDVFFTVDGADPTVGGSNEYVVAGVVGESLDVVAGNLMGSTVVKLISSGTPSYTVIGLVRE